MNRGPSSVGPGRGNDAEMRREEEDVAGIEWMVRQGSSSWLGPTPHADRARWATGGQRRPVDLVLKGVAASVLFTGLVFFSVVAVAASMAPGGISSVPRTVSDVLTQRAPLAPASATPAATHQSEGTPRPAATMAVPAPVVVHPPPTPSPEPREDERSPAPVVPPAAGSSPTPSQRPDD
jgi:hypothetical protein